MDLLAEEDEEAWEELVAYIILKEDVPVDFNVEEAYAAYCALETEEEKAAYLAELSEEDQAALLAYIAEQQPEEEPE